MKIKKLFLLILIFSCSEKKTDTSQVTGSLKEKLHKKMLHKKRYSYLEARKILLGKIHLAGSGRNSYIEDVYCLKKFSNKDISSKYKIGAGKVPDHTIINTEHVWPKSKFFSRKKRFNKRDRKSEFKTRETDLHILYPSDTHLNERRSSFKFGDVIDKDKRTVDFLCSEAQLGKTLLKGRKSKDTFFEPPPKSKGNVARAMFYYSIRYNEPISYYEESFLKKWNMQDPPDKFEKMRNDLIEHYQGNRNPFIDDYNLANQIEDF